MGRCCGSTAISTQKCANSSRKALTGQIAQLQAEAGAYDQLRSTRTKAIHVTNINGLPTALIKARIASSLTQAELANSLGIHENLLQRYETSEFASVSLHCVAEIMQCLEVPVVFAVEAEVQA